jgi:hypothetical protein
MAKKGAVRPAGLLKQPRIVGGTEKGRVQEISRGIAAETNSGRVNKEEAVRLAIGNHPRAGVEEIVGLLKEQDLNVSAALVRLIRSEMRGGGEATGRQGGGRPKGEAGVKGASTSSRRTRGDAL